MKNVVLFLCLFAVGASDVAVASQTKTPPVLHQTTDWRIEPSFKFDTLCFLGVLTGDPFYVGYYKTEYAEFEPQLTPDAQAALANLKRKIKDENHNIISAFLTLYFSATDDETLDDMLKTLQNSEGLKKNFQQTPYFDDSGWKLYESIREDLKAVLSFLKNIHFDDYWKRNILPKVQQKIRETVKDVSNYNVIAEVEKHLGSPLPSNQITIYLLYYSRPHGIKITGTRFITNIEYPFDIVMRNAIHEMMHPPFDLSRDRALAEALNSLQEDVFLMDKVLHHNPSFGYNSFAGFIEEDCVQSLDQVISEKFKVELDARKRWKNNDDGMHVLAVALYSLMKEEHFTGERESFRDFLIRMIRSGRLKAGRIKPINDAFYS